ncbi:MAG: hypothetical protein ACD_2C00193G0014 [uncultured bacterium (gcode 4)]|uniref:Phosphoglycerate mutase n=1 Tax=uncultured bacterium (gcode 4) TaxID=1234023 RepID=K2G255_9BACT|nr:MAG: hypothetical protein ACD_2C00193G0014 [uncultured bacterium (gcode 4)]
MPFLMANLIFIFHFYRIMKIFITRHGETLENRAWIFQWHIDWTLSDDGIEQAKKLALRLSGEEIDIIYCSPLWRTKDTLKQIQEYKAATEVIFTRDLVERDAWDATWKKWDEVDFTVAKWVETNEALRKRAWEFLDEIMRNHSSWNILLVTHWWFIKWLFAYIHNIPEPEMVWRYASNNCSLSLIEIEWSKLKEIYFNDTSHI